MIVKNVWPLSRAFWFSRLACCAVCGGEVGREGARTPRAAAGGLAALLHHLPCQQHGKTKKPCQFANPSLTGSSLHLYTSEVFTRFFGEVLTSMPVVNR